MLNSTESRLWLAVHLLYPNAAQAFDVYQAVVLQSEEALESNANSLVFSKLVQAFEKIPPISSNLAFYEFEFDQIDQWKTIYKNSQKNQLIMFVGVLLFDLRLSEIAPYVKLTADKAQFLFHQIFKKLAQSSSKLKYSEPLNFKKQNDTKISYLFTYENLVDYCLGQLSPEDHEKVKAGLELYPVLQSIKDEYAKIISQIQNLKVQKSERPAAAKKAAPKAPSPKKTDEEKMPFPRSKKIIAAAGVSLLVLIAVSFGLVGHLQNKKRSIVIQQVEKPVEKKPEVAVAVSAEVAASVPPASVPVSQEAAPPAEVAAVKAPVAEPVKAVKPAQPPVEKVKPNEKAEGGLYRGTLVVKNLAGVNDRIKDKLGELGAVKAGEVELGWMKSPNLAYYHYIIPSDDIDQAAAFLKQFGTLNVKFEKHPRSVPGGHRRFIIEITEK